MADTRDDPILRQKEAAAYLGICPRQLRRLTIARVRIPGTSLFGYRRSALNAAIEQANNPQSRKSLRRAS